MMTGRRLPNCARNVVVDIEASLEEHKVQAVVYDQQAPVTGRSQGAGAEIWNFLW